jgi:hypothetical protein
MTSPAKGAHEDDRTEALEAEVRALQTENARLRGLLGLDAPSRQEATAMWKATLFTDAESCRTRFQVDRGSPAKDKVALFRNLFAGRDDVYAIRWENQKSGKSGWGPAVEGGWANTRSPNRAYLPYDDEVVQAHLGGHLHAGLYPLEQTDSCRLLVCDFDGSQWVLDSLAYLDAAHATGVPAFLERSRSGDGGHVWVFFGGRIPAASARRIGFHLLREAMTMRAELDLLSYDRLFPAQDFMPKGTFGNLIALPLNGACRKKGTTVFLDPSSLEPFEDQWSFLSSIEPLPAQSAVELAEMLGVLATGPDSVTYRKPPKDHDSPKPPKRISAKARAMLTVDRIGMPPAMLAALKHLGSVHNPEFYEKEKLRFSTWNTPQFIRCYRETLDALLLPRGLRDKAIETVAAAGSELVIADAYGEVPSLTAHLRSTLTAQQGVAVDMLAKHEMGMLVAPPGSGKTVVGCALIARHQLSTLVIVDRKPLLEQWRERLVTHLSLAPKQVGQLGGGRNKATGVIDVAMIQSLARRDDIDELTAGYGMVIVDECHHVPAVTFERAVREIPVRRWIGLTATPYRRDGLQAIMAMHCGPVRHTMRAPDSPVLRTLDLIVHETSHDVGATQHIQTTFRSLVEDVQRTEAICDDIEISASDGRNCLVLTRWTEHLASITNSLEERGVSCLILHGQMSKKARMAVMAQLEEPFDRGNGNVLVATSSLLGEGFDCPPLDTLFLAFPIKFKGSVVQCVGRVLRPTNTKTRVEVHDYVDVRVPVLARMHHERRRAYQSLGFNLPKLPR